MKFLSLLGKQKIKDKCSQKKFGKILPQVTNLTTVMERTRKERNPPIPVDAGAIECTHYRTQFRDFSKQLKEELP